jgi:purine-binding chemotaxis protein CheW
MHSEEMTETIVGANQYLTFTLGDEDFAFDIGKVREVLDYITITKVPRMPAFLCGVINLRGNVVPVVDLRYKLGMGTIKQSVDTCIVIVEIMIDDEMTHMGILADSVKEVIDLDPGQISATPKLGVKINNEFIKGMGKQGEKFLMILDIDKVLTADELDVAQRTGEAREAGAGKADFESEVPPVPLGADPFGMAETVSAGAAA